LWHYMEWGRLEMGCLVGILAHNWTEAGFKGLSFSLFVFFVIAVRYRREQVFSPDPSLLFAPVERGEEVYFDAGMRAQSTRGT
ncbi:MAG: hypothetical protein H0U23_11400, partial [Blastocatellia bacterium]|nr:hypothetical protein [Blastocatellia bacterium]